MWNQLQFGFRTSVRLNEKWLWVIPSKRPVLLLCLQSRQHPPAVLKRNQGLPHIPTPFCLTLPIHLRHSPVQNHLLNHAPLIATCHSITLLLAQKFLSVSLALRESLKGGPLPMVIIILIVLFGKICHHLIFIPRRIQDMNIVLHRIIKRLENTLILLQCVG